MIVWRMIREVGVYRSMGHLRGRDASERERILERGEMREAGEER